MSLAKEVYQSGRADEWSFMAQAWIGNPVLPLPTETIVPSDGSFRGSVLSSPPEILQLDRPIHRLMPRRDTTLAPGFFLATLSSDWKPRVVVVARGKSVAGVVYAKERLIVGWPSGIVLVDGRWEAVVGNVVDRERLFTVAIESLFTSGVARAVRLAIPPAGFEARAVAAAHTMLSLELTYSEIPTHQLHACLPLLDDYDDLVQSFGPKTRRNFRYYRRRFEEAGHRYVPNVSPLMFHQAAEDLRPKCRIRSTRDEVGRAVNVLASAEHPWIVGLKHRNGSWLSLAGGWYSGRRAVMFFQLNNDRDYEAASLSIVLRGYLIETLIRGGTRELAFWSGTSAPLSHYATCVPAMAAHLDKRSLAWRTTRALVGKAEPWISQHVSAEMSWITGANRLSSVPLSPPLIQDSTGPADDSQVLFDSERV